jgi:hypothetical protein
LDELWTVVWHDVSPDSGRRILFFVLSGQSRSRDLTRR